jgi:hypothetical protein
VFLLNKKGRSRRQTSWEEKRRRGKRDGERRKSYEIGVMHDEAGVGIRAQFLWVFGDEFLTEEAMEVSVEECWAWRHGRECPTEIEQIKLETNA